MWYNSGMTSEESTIEEAEAVSNKVEQVGIIDSDQDLDESLLIEEDGDSFWVVQQVVWGIIKTIALVAAIGFVIWFVWSGAEHPFQSADPRAEVDPSVVVENRISESRIVEQNSVGPTVVKSHLLLGLAHKVDRLESINRVSQQGILGESIAWLDQAQTIGQISPSLLRIAEPGERAQKIASVLEIADQLLQTSRPIQSRLSSQIDERLARKAALDQETANLDRQVLLQLQQYRSDQVDALLEQKINLKSQTVRLAEEGLIRQTLLKNIQNYDRLIRSQTIPLFQPSALEPVQ